MGDDDLWLWIERNMWHATTVQNLGFGADVKRAVTAGGKEHPCETVVSWTAEDGPGSAVHTDAHCYAASDQSEVVFTVNFTAPADTKNIRAIVDVQEVTEVVVPPPVPQATTAEVKK